jgi:hypothetical protein
VIFITDILKKNMANIDKYHFSALTNFFLNFCPSLQVTRKKYIIMMLTDNRGFFSVDPE